MVSQLQSVILPKINFTINDAVKWIIEHGYDVKKIDETFNYWRFRQKDPNYLTRLGFNKVISKELPNGVILIIYYKY